MIYSPGETLYVLRVAESGGEALLPRKTVEDKDKHNKKEERRENSMPKRYEKIKFLVSNYGDFVRMALLAKNRGTPGLQYHGV
jgi:hypothetical protein